MKWNLLILIFFTNSIFASEFGFDKNLQEWGMWGDGLGSHTDTVGHKRKGSLWLSSDFGETHTAHYRWTNLKAGVYKISAYVRAEDVQNSQDQTSFWHFHDGGYGETSVFRDLHGSYEWRKVEYTVKVKNSTLSVWFRLKSPGQVWVDDFQINEADAYDPKVTIENSKALLERGPVASKIIRSPKREVTILDFDKIKSPNSFIKTKMKSGSAGQFKPAEYYHLDVKKVLNGRWQGFERVELDVFNGAHDFLDFFLTLKDNNSVNYWSQLNHKTQLAPGWNRLSFSLAQYLGERGSHRFRRPLDLNNLTDFFIVADPDRKLPNENVSLYVDNIKLINNPYPEIPEGLQAFDFTSHKDQINSGFKKVTSQTLYKNESSYGFVDPVFWRVEDSQYASSTLRYSIGLKQGTFRIKLPNGKYKILLSIDKLGFWDPPFWKRRSVRINEKPFIVESRSTGAHFLKDYLRFENIEPFEDDHPYDLYLSKIFTPYKADVTVTNNVLDIQFEGDASGISLNRLFVWKSDKEEESKKFLSELDIREKKEFDWMSRKISAAPSPNIKEKISVIQPDLYLSPSGARYPSSKIIKLMGGAGEKPYQTIQINVNGEADIQWKVTDLKSDEGKIIPGGMIRFNEVINQYVSPDMNHETYMVVGKYLRSISGQSLLKSGEGRKYLWLEFPITKMFSPGKYRGEVSFNLNGESHRLPLEINIQRYTLPKIDFPVGFFGLDPIGDSWFESPDMKVSRRKYRQLVLEELLTSGFTTFSGLPEAKIDLKNSRLWLDTSDLEDIFKKAKEYGTVSTVFTYGGKFPHTAIDESNKPFDMDSERYHSELRRILKSHLENPEWPKIVHTFSDEAGGYSDRVTEDLEKAKFLKSKYSFLPLGGFSSMKGENLRKLNKLFDYGFYSSFEKSYAKELEAKGKKWGGYNGAPGNLHDPRFAFGPGLFVGRQSGLSHYLEWHATGFSNYPYYDFDGRESDVSMFLPSSDGKLHPTLKYVFAVQGLNAYRKLVLLNDLIISKKGKIEALRKASAWIADLKDDSKLYQQNEYLRGRDFNFVKFEEKLNHHLAQILE